MMRPLDIKKYSDTILQKKCSLVEKVTRQDLVLAESMLSTMRYFEGIGLAAPQIGVSKRLIVADIGQNPLVL